MARLRLLTWVRPSGLLPGFSAGRARFPAGHVRQKLQTPPPGTNGDRVALVEFDVRRQSHRLKSVLPILALLAASTNDYPASIETWRRQYEESLRAPQGWLSVAGLFWLHEGANRAGSDPQSDIVLPAPAPRFAANREFHSGVARITPAPGVPILVNGKPSSGQALQPDTTDHPDIVSLGMLSLTVIQRGPRTGVRLRDPESAARRQFSGLPLVPDR